MLVSDLSTGGVEVDWAICEFKFMILLLSQNTKEKKKREKKRKEKKRKEKKREKEKKEKRWGKEIVITEFLNFFM